MGVCLEHGPVNPAIWPLSGLPPVGLDSFAVQTPIKNPGFPS